ncbi:MAG TPA: hypothetical protein VIU16_10525, partial [Gaiellaceae bacterium]
MNRSDLPERTVALALAEAPRPRPAAREAIFDVDGLTVGYGGSTAIRDVSIEIYQRAITAVIGPSG